MRILTAQINPTIGDLQGNTKKILQVIQNGRAKKADLILFPELALSGYPPEDLLLLPNFLDQIMVHLNEIIAASQGLGVIVGLPRLNPNKLEKTLCDSAAIIYDGALIGYQDKVLLPTYDVFDERRYFEPGGPVHTWQLAGKKVGITICEDLWQHSGLIETTHYRRDPVLELKEAQPDLVLNLSASPYSFTKFDTRLQVCLRASASLECPIIWCNQVGGNDSLIFDGYSLYVSPDGLLQYAQGFQEEAMLIDIEKKMTPIQIERNPFEDLYKALALGLKDYFGKLGFKKACIGLSGGIDSALVACLAADVLGPDNVHALFMPSRYTSKESQRDALQLAKNLGIGYEEISIEPIFEVFLQQLQKPFKNYMGEVTQENLQARIRGMLLMAFSNNFGYIVLSTGNKSEMAVGYSTLYGDMCGGLGVINDVTKLQVYALANWINRNGEIIPKFIIQREPTAELKPNQKDSDTLPPYDILDKVLCAYIEDHLPPREIALKYKYDLALVEDVIRRIHANEYKRRQAPPGLRVSEKAFSIGRRFPIVEKWV